MGEKKKLHKRERSFEALMHQLLNRQMYALAHPKVFIIRTRRLQTHSSQTVEVF